MVKSQSAYYLNGDRFTSSRFRRLSRAKKIEAMLEWFGGNYEDPAQRTSYNTREGGYLWNHGGPFDANEELYEEFGSVADEEVITAAVEQIEEDGITEWASSRNEYYDDPTAEPIAEDDGISSVADPLPDWAFDPPEGDSDPRGEMLGSLGRFEAALDHYINQRTHRGHNHPPELVNDEDPLSDTDISDSRAAIEQLRNEAGKEQPDEQRVSQAALVIHTLANKLRNGAKFVVAAVVSGAAYDGAKWAYEHQEALFGTAMEVASTAAKWAEKISEFW